MSWNSDWYPGRLALLCTGQPLDSQAFLQRFAEDHASFVKASEVAGSSQVLKRLVEWSCFQTPLVADCWGL
eukprot:11196241-Lingulodinium_polyedra.AAC.1